MFNKIVLYLRINAPINSFVDNNSSSMHKIYDKLIVIYSVIINVIIFN